MSRLEIEGLCKTLGDKRAASASVVLRGVTFSISDSECLGLRGATGSGKTTLLRIIAGLNTPDTGSVSLDGTVLSSPSTQVPPGQRGIGMVFQNLGLWPHLTVQGHLDYVLSATRMSAGERQQRRQETLETFLLRDLAARFPAELSGGERHLLALARALCADIRILLMDEPFTGLDGALKERVLQTLNKERSRRQLTTLLVTHNEDEIRLLCQRVEHLSEGRIVVHAARKL